MRCRGSGSASDTAARYARYLIISPTVKIFKRSSLSYKHTVSGALMVEFTQTEQDYINELLACIHEAISRNETVSYRLVNKTKLQKLLYLGISEFDLPVTHSWYLAGAIVESDQQVDEQFDSLPSTDSPDSPSMRKEAETEGNANIEELNNNVAEFAGAGDLDLPTRQGPKTNEPDEVTEDTIDPILFPAQSQESSDGEPDTSPDKLEGRRNDVVDFYANNIPEVVNDDTMHYLQKFYHDHAPDEYRDLYIQSTHLRIRLRSVTDIVSAYLNNETPDQSLGELVEEVGLDISDLHCTIRSSETLAQTLQPFVRGTDVIEDALMMLSQKEPDAYTKQDRSIASSLEDFYYYHVWRYPCLLISRETATGPSAESLRVQRQDRFEGFAAELEREIEQFEQLLDKAGLKPSYTDYPNQQDDIGGAVQDLASKYLEK